MLHSHVLGHYIYSIATKSHSGFRRGRLGEAPWKYVCQTISWLSSSPWRHVRFVVVLHAWSTSMQCSFTIEVTCNCVCSYRQIHILSYPHYICVQLKCCATYSIGCLANFVLKVRLVLHFPKFVRLRPRIAVAATLTLAASSLLGWDGRNAGRLIGVTT